MTTSTLLRPLVAVLLLALGTAQAESLSCPDLAQARQVGACPSEEELKITYSGYCSDDNKAYRGETDVCVDFALYRQLKNVALWESADGNFNAYVSCEQPAQAVKALQPKTLQLLRQGTLSRLVCTYDDSVAFTFRTRAQCQVTQPQCAAGAGACAAECK